MSEKTITVEWEFNIGDFVVCKEGIEAFIYGIQMERFTDKTPNIFEVKKRIIQECHGGIQKFYEIGFLHPPLRVPHYSVVSKDEAIRIIKEYREKKRAEEKAEREATSSGQ